MQLKWCLVISCYWVTNVLGQYRGYGITGSRFGVQPAYSSSVWYRPLSSAYYYPSAVSTSSVPRYTTWQVTPGINTYSYNTVHIPAPAPALSSPVRRSTYVATTSKSIPAQTYRSIPSSFPQVQKYQSITNSGRNNQALVPPPLPSSRYLYRTTYVTTTSKSIPAKTYRSNPSSLPQVQKYQYITNSGRINQALVPPPLPSSRNLYRHNNKNNIVTKSSPVAKPAVQTLNSQHVLRAATAPSLSSVLGQSRYVTTTSKSIPAKTYRSNPASFPQVQKYQTITNPVRINQAIVPLSAPSSRNLYLSSSASKPGVQTVNSQHVPRAATAPALLQPSPITKISWKGVKTIKTKQNATNNMSPGNTPPQKFDEYDGKAPRKPRNDMVNGLSKRIVKSALSRPNGRKMASIGLNSAVIGSIGEDNRIVHEWKPSFNSKIPKPPSKIVKNQVIVIAILISIILIAGGVGVYYCNRN